ncbi:hypothetical protein KP509_06G066000 [Ceratopteris richardii]|uniref:Uncharacterized protein n=1 Tax=Ceratopteris richardii TaxID=49495 RepID=A0A8T2UJ43_CERRI|nr:hypothetical protein KP509_06G066000 [Ceratopteris richardii]
MAWSNFLVTVLGVGAVWMLIRSDLRQSSAVFSRNVRHVRNWLEKEAASSSSSETEKLKPKEIEKPPVEKKVSKDENSRS